MPTLNTVIDQLFNITYKARELNKPTNKTIFEAKYKKFWNSSSKNFFKSKLEFAIDGTMHESNIGDQQQLKPQQLWFEGCRFSKSPDTYFDRSKQYIILICDSDHYYEEFEDKMKAITKSFANVICFNPPGVGTSPGSINSPDDYKNVLCAIIDNLHYRGIRHDHIILLGHGYGACIALAAALEYQQRKQCIKVIADRSFASIASMAGLEVKNETKAYFKNHFLGAYMGMMAHDLVKTLVKLFGLNINSAATFTKINTLNPGHAKAIIAVNDQEIPEAYNLASGVSANMQCFLMQFDCDSLIISQHDADLSDLTIKDQEPHYNNSAQYYLDVCLNAFRNESRAPAPSAEWADRQEQKSSKSWFFGKSFTIGFPCMHKTKMTCCSKKPVNIQPQQRYKYGRT